MTARHAVVVTGMGVVSPLGDRVDAFSDALLAGKSGIGPITVFDASTLPTRIAGQAPLPAEVPLGDRKVAFALAAARSALEASGLALDAGGAGSGAPRADAGVSLGVGLELFNMDHLAAARRPGFALPEGLAARLGFLQTPSEVCVHALGHRFGLAAPPLVHVSACAAGTDAIGAAYRLIAAGRRRVMLAGGTDSMINPLGVAGFCALQATSLRNDRPETASRPFDRTRDGFVMGEGAAVLVLERLDDARARGARILAEVAGYGSSFDAYKISDPHPEGRGAFLAMARALADAGIGADEVDAVNAHGTGTPKNDPAETLALKRLLGERARGVPISATKSMIGHLISASGAVEAVAAIACMLRGAVHPTINLHEPDPACDLDYVPNEARAHRQRHVLSSSYGFGGHNAAIVLRHPEAIRP
ncbi:beta-ketoacyl-[acyl-carrier-protein] synthase family protein [Sorangium sp. So ce406]|uniref:beta-ketoacyl-[acyl-carrier-protein] synthase family protein n=1 Tax=Sorangium sp. So ce406 TaxID=3133311 RepID=UPI003F5BDB58